MPAVTTRKVLVVEDDESFRLTLERLLARAGYDVVTVTNPQVALRIAATEPLDLVVSDFDLPVMNGGALAEALQAQLGTLAPPVVVLTGGDPRRADSPAVAGVAEKPASAGELLALFEAALAGR
ncbi:MAG: response regulator [Polyangiaceae bacterium]